MPRKKTAPAQKNTGPVTRDYFAELYVAGMFGDAGWTVYFPKRDVGFDFVASKTVGNTTLLRPVQVKGKYPESGSSNSVTYGFEGDLSVTHPEMVLAIAYFDAHERGVAPSQVAYMPMPTIKPRSRGGWRCVPAKLQADRVLQRLYFAKYFGEAGLNAVEDPKWHLVPAPEDTETAQGISQAQTKLGTTALRRQHKPAD